MQSAKTLGFSAWGIVGDIAFDFKNLEHFI